MNYSTFQSAIRKIDRQIDAIRSELRSRITGKFSPTSAADWQVAWDRHPELRAQETALFRQRGELQLQRDNAWHEQEMRAARARRPAKQKQCPACKGSGFAKPA